MANNQEARIAVLENENVHLREDMRDLTEAVRSLTISLEETNKRLEEIAKDYDKKKGFFKGAVWAYGSVFALFTGLVVAFIDLIVEIFSYKMFGTGAK